MIHSGKIPDSITAQTRNGLRRIMFLNNSKHGKQFQYFDIQQITENEKLIWCAWFLPDSDYEEIEKNGDA